MLFGLGDDLVTNIPINVDGHATDELLLLSVLANLLLVIALLLVLAAYMVSSIKLSLMPLLKLSVVFLAPERSTVARFRCLNLFNRATEHSLHLLRFILDSLVEVLILSFQLCKLFFGSWRL